MDEVRYSIKDLENFTKIKAHTIRIWEQRYRLLSPNRTETNIRYYDENDLKKILNINLLYNSGHKISKIASLSEAEIINASKALILEEDSKKQSEIDAITVLILAFNGDEIKKFLEEFSSSNSFEELYTCLVLPLLEKLGQLWQVNTINIIHEHYFSNIFKEFLIAKTHALSIPLRPVKNALLFLHANEEHEFGILLYLYLLKKSGYTCHYFGQKVPVMEVKLAFSQLNPEFVITTFTARITEKKFREIENELIILSKKSEVIISGSRLNYFDFSISKDLLHINSISELLSLLKKRGA